ncbi:MAG: hypothetical protein HY736_19895 [Verrucomicrobia bacterium]|nr:hypothetical protein [Verrucomicrobiota bacterium]
MNAVLHRLIALCCAGAVLRAAASSVPITLANYTAMPVHATAVALDHRDLCMRLGVPEGTPVAIHPAAGGAALRVEPGREADRPVVRCLVSLSPRSRVDLLATAAAAWPDRAWIRTEGRPDGGQALLGNGIVRWALGPGGWEFGFDPAVPEGAVLIRGGTLDFWVDRENRGRILNGEPADYGLESFRAARLERAAAAVTPDGRPTVTIVRRMAGFASAMTVHETFELLPGQPLLVCRVRWQNDGDTPLWIAYVKSGDGIRGQWAAALLTRPLVQRKKSAELGDLDGSETRPAWVGEIFRNSMESPATGCGVGLSTLLPTPSAVGTGSMIWGMSGTGFQCNFIDPVQGQFPFLVPARGSLENGFVFLAAQTGASVFRQTLDLWRALQQGRLPRLPAPCAVFVGDAPVQAQTVATAPDFTALLAGNGAVRRAAIAFEPHQFIEGRLTFTGASATAPVEVTARRLSGPASAAGAGPVRLLRATAPGPHFIDFKSLATGDTLPELALEISLGDGAQLKEFGLAERLPVAPRSLSPLAGATCTSFATMFRWQGLPGIVDYEVQWAPTRDFASPHAQRVALGEPCPWYVPDDAQLPAPGAWFWRVRGLKPGVEGAWSEARTFTVTAERPRQPLRRPLTAAAPLFTVEATRVLNYADFRPDFPADLAPHLAIVAEGFENKGIPVDEFARGMKGLPEAFMLRSHWVGLADLEWLFQHVPNFVGIQGGEHLSSLYRDGRPKERLYHHRMIRLCAQYGMFYQEADGTYRDDKWQELMDQQGAFVREFGPWLVLSQKNNIIRRQFYSQSAALGLWLGGITHQHGAWEDGGFYWQNAGFNGLGRCDGERRGVLKTMPRIFWDLVIVMGAARGCGLYSLDGQTLMVGAKEADQGTALPSGLWDNTGRTTDTFRRFVAPLIRGIVQHGLIPTKEQVRGDVKLAVFNDHPRVDEKVWPHYAEYGPLFAGTYGFRKMGQIDGQLWEFFPNTGRYHFIPVLVQGDEPLGGGIRNLPVSQLQTTARVKEIFDAAYAPWYEGDAFVSRAGDAITVLNSRENEDVTESYSVPLGGGTLQSLAGKVGPHAYLVAKIEDNGRRLWLQANTEYAERDTELVITCVHRPEWKILPAAAAKQATWDEATRRLTLRLGHAQGAAEVTLK